MPVDTSIYSRVSKGGNLGDLVDSYNKGYESHQQRKLSDLALKQAELDASRNQAINDAYSGNVGADGKINRHGMVSQLSAGGHGMAIPQLQQAWSTQDKSEAETRLKQMDAAKKQVDYFHSTMAGLLAMPEITDDALIRATSDAVNRGFIGQDEALEFVRSMPPDQTSRRAILMDGIAQSVDAAKQLEMFSPKVSAQNLGGHTQMVDTNPLTNPGVVGQRLERSATIGEQESARHNRASEGLTARGQNMTDARSREANATALSRPFEVTGPDGTPMLVQQDKAGNIRPVANYLPSSGKEKNLTDSQAKSVAFGARTQASNRIFDELEARGTTTSILGSQAGYLGDVITGLSSEDQQRLDQAKRDFINAVLRRESGAVISQSEFENAERQYFPQYGEGKGTIMQKRRNREIAMRGIQAEVPENKRYLIGEVIGSDSAGDSNGSSSGKVVNFSDLN